MKRKLITFFLALLSFVVSGALGGLIGGFGASVAAPLLGISSREGESGYFMILIGGICAVLAALIGTVFTLHFRGVRGFRIFTGCLTVVVGIVAIVALGGAGYYSLPQPLNRDGPTPQLVYEFRPPASASFPLDTSEFSAAINTNENRMVGAWDSAAQPAARSLTGRVDLYYRTSQRLLVLSLPDHTDNIFRLKLPSNPTGGSYANWSEWQKADFIGHPDQGQPVAVGPEPEIEVRYKVEMPN